MTWQLNNMEKYSPFGLHSPEWAIGLINEGK